MAKYQAWNTKTGKAIGQPFESRGRDALETWEDFELAIGATLNLPLHEILEMTIEELEESVNIGEV